MPMKTMWSQAAKDYVAGYLAGIGTGIFLVCIPFKEITLPSLARLALGTLGLALMIYGWYYTSRARTKPEVRGIEAEPNAAP